MIFADRDLLRRMQAALLPPAAGYRRTRQATPASAPPIRAAVTAAVATLFRPELATQAGAGFLASLACDDLDALTAALWPRAWRERSFIVEGAGYLPPAGPLVVASFHLSGGFRVFDALAARGFRPAFLRVPFSGEGSRYQRIIERARAVHFRRVLGDRLIEVGPQARERLRAHLAEGGAVVALLDVAPASLGLRDTATAVLFGREVRLAVGLMRLAVDTGASVLPYEGRIENDARILRFHPPVTGSTPEEILRATVAALELVIRQRPWDWQGWLDFEVFLENRPRP
ncbi:MAG: hypothetical protein VCC00_04780 [Deltaproteobacteria bacterium]